MPKLMGNEVKTPTGFTYSGVGVEDLGASEYTLVVIAQDTSTSVEDYKKEMEDCLKQILDACKKSPRSENLLLRLMEFNSQVGELHGYRELSKVDPSEYDNLLDPRGWTALYDGTMDALESVDGYSRQLGDMDYLCNAIVFVITDGGENKSRISTTNMIRDKIKEIKSESNMNLESLKVILVGVGTDPYVMDALERFENETELDQFVKIGEATPGKLAKLAAFVSQSVSSTSQALGTGGPSQSLTF